MVRVHRSDDGIGGFEPTHVAQHHLAGQDHRAGVDLVEVGVLGCGAVRRLEYRMAGQVVDVAPRRNSDTAHLRSQRIGQIVRHSG